MESSRRKIFLVDDVKYYLVAIKERLKSKYEIYPIQTAESLLEMLVNVTPELILLDINMPDTDGFEIIKMLKENPTYETIPVVFLTGSKDKESMVKAMKLGANDFILKPFTDNDIIDSVEVQLNPQAKARNKPIVLAIDDNPSILMSVKQLLSDSYTVFTLPKAESCREILKVTVPDLFLLDIQMPTLSGFDLVAIIREHEEHELTPIVFLTSESDVNTVSKAIYMGAVDYITKPIDDAILREKMAAHLKSYLMRRRIRDLTK
ncbi:MAG: response regulator [Lachnospiraceae bacterium]|jgi:putative two-component system response regulator|nr:response regulator [Lachnospiraceae bacterium]